MLNELLAWHGWLPGREAPSFVSAFSFSKVLLPALHASNLWPGQCGTPEEINTLRVAQKHREPSRRKPFKIKFQWEIRFIYEQWVLVVLFMAEPRKPLMNRFETFQKYFRRL